MTATESPGAPDGPMRQRLLRLVAASSAVCLGTWLALLSAGDIGLQRSISQGALTLFEQPLAVGLVAAMGFAIAYLSAKRLRLSAVPLVIGVLLGDAFAGLVMAPIAIGELEPIHAPLVFAAVSLLGVQPAASLAGAVLARPYPRDTAKR